MQEEFGHYIAVVTPYSSWTIITIGDKPVGQSLSSIDGMGQAFTHSPLSDTSLPIVAR